VDNTTVVSLILTATYVMISLSRGRMSLRAISFYAVAGLLLANLATTLFLITLAVCTGIHFFMAWMSQSDEPVTQNVPDYYFANSTEEALEMLTRKEDAKAHAKQSQAEAVERARRNQYTDAMRNFFKDIKISIDESVIERRVVFQKLGKTPLVMEREYGDHGDYLIYANDVDLVYRGNAKGAVKFVENWSKKLRGLM
jgi:hypothetical protein